MRRAKLPSAFQSVIVVLIGIVSSASAPGGEMHFEGCYARWSETELAMGNSLIERKWNIKDGLLTATSFRDLKSGFEWIAQASNSPSPSSRVPIRDFPKVTIDAHATQASPVSAKALLVSIAAGSQAPKRYELSICPESQGITIRIKNNKASVETDVATGASRSGAGPTGFETPDPNTNTFESGDSLEKLTLSPTHLRLIQVNLTDQTDRHNELVSEREWLLMKNEQPISARGNLFIVEDALTSAGLIFLKQAPLPDSRPIKDECDLYVNPGTKLFRLCGHNYPFVVLAYNGGRNGRIEALQNYQRQVRQYAPSRDGLFLSNTWGDRSQDSRINETFIQQEILAGARIGVDVIQMDDGWQKGRSANSASGKGAWVIRCNGEVGLILGRRGADNQWTWERQKPSPEIKYHVTYFLDKDGVYWFQAPGKKLGRFAGGQFEILEQFPGLAGDKIQALARDSNGQIWVGTDKQIGRLEHTSFTNLNPEGAGSKFYVSRITSTPDGGVWVEGSGKLLLFQREHWSKPVSEWNSKLEPWSQMNSFVSDNSGGLWISLKDGLAHVNQDGQLVRVTSADGLLGQFVQVFFTDHEGNFWGGYNRGGLFQLRKETFHTIRRSEGLEDRIVTSLTEDSAGTIWMGMASGSVLQWQDGTVASFPLPQRASTSQDAVVAAGPDGRVWVGTTGNGLLVWSNNGFQNVLLPAQVPVGVRQLLVTKSGNVWFANNYGLYRLDGTNITRVVASSAPDQTIAALTQGTDGSIWFGTFGGILKRWHDGQLTSFQPSDGGAPTRFWALCCETNGTIWIGAMNGGLLRFSDGKFRRFTTADGLADDYISHILTDDFGNLWLGSRAGVMCVSKDSIVAHEIRNRPIHCRLFGITDGLPTVAMTLEFQLSCLKTHDGSLWFGSPKGPSWVNPGEVRPIVPPPSIVIESVWADNNLRKFSEAAPHSAVPEIVLEPGVKNLEVRFTAPTFTAPKLTRFKYRLDKIDTGWNDIGDQRKVIFNQLAAGDYVFRVTARNSDGLQSQQPAEIRLIVNPYFWQRKSVQAAALIFLVGIAALTARRITQVRFRRKLEVLRQQQQIERERTRIAQDLHDDLGAGLTEISMASDLAENPDISQHETRQYTHEIGERARGLVQRMDEIVWAVNPRNDTIASLSSYAAEYAQRFSQPFSIECVLDIQPDLPESHLNAEQRYNFFLAFKEVLNNVARHAGATTLNLAIHSENGKLVFVIADNGCGFVPAAERAGADGLRNIRERILRLGGECEITSQPGQGTRVMLRVPISNSAAKTKS